MASASIMSKFEFENELLASVFSSMMGVEVVTSKNFERRKYEETIKGNHVVDCLLDFDTFFQFTYNTLTVENFVYNLTGHQLPHSYAPLRSRHPLINPRASASSSTRTDYGITNNSILIRGGGGDEVCIIKLDASSRDPQFDYDFTNIKDTTVFTRGGKTYYRPCGWNRIAIKVLGKYKDNKWLTNGDNDKYGDWPVSYHGTSETSAISIAGGEYRISKTLNGRAYGDGVYSSPTLNIPSLDRYSEPIMHDNKKYKIILQNRLNLKDNKTDVFPNRSIDGAVGDIYLTPDPHDIHPYGLLYKQV